MALRHRVVKNLRPPDERAIGGGIVDFECELVIRRRQRRAVRIRKPALIVDERRHRLSLPLKNAEGTEGRDRENGKNPERRALGIHIRKV